METKEVNTCNSSSAKKLVLACSGASDLGELSDRVARKLMDKGVYSMKCLAMVGADNKELIETIKTTETLVIDGCPIDCGRKIMEEAWLTNYQYIRLTDLGYVKGQTPVSEVNIDRISSHIIDSNNIETIEQELLFKQPDCSDETCDMFDFMSDHVGLKILHPGGKDSTRQMLSLLGLHKDLKVLDIACGKGRTSVGIAKKYGCKVVGLDILEKSVEEAKKYAKKKGVEHLVTFIKADAENLPFADNEFDVTIAQAMLILVNNKASVTREAFRVLKSGGRSAWTELSWKKPTETDFQSTASKAICSKCISNVVTFNEWQKIFNDAGYNSIEVHQLDMNYRGFSRMILDEGIINGLKVMRKYLTKPTIRKRMVKLDNFFKVYPEYLGYGIFIGKKST